MRTVHLVNEAATRRLAEEIAGHLRPGDVVLLDGPLGAGKTCLVRGLVEALGGDPTQVSSPTFTLLHRYTCAMVLIHVDAYRLAGAGDLAALGFDELREGAVAAVEWAERVQDGIQARRCWRIRLDHAASGRSCAITEPEETP